jgi:replicative DNA helicase
MPFDSQNSQQNGKRKWVNYKELNQQAIPSPLRALRVPPQNIDAEMALLGSIMLRPLGLNEIMDSVSADSFYVEKHRLMYQAMLELARKNEPIDIVSLTAILREQGVLDTVGGPAYLSELTGNVPTSTNIEYYANLVARKSTLRNLIQAGDEIVELGFDEAKEIEEVLDAAEKRVMGVTGATGRAQKFQGIKEILPNTWETLMKTYDNKDGLRGVPTGFRDLDKLLAGFQKSDLIILAARPSVGKTSIALNMAKHAAIQHNIPVGIFSLEMSAQSLVDRLLSSESGVDSWKMKTGQGLTEADMDQLTEASSRLSSAPIYIDDKAGNTILGMRSTARRLKSEFGLGLIVVDYLQLMGTSKNYDSMVNQITEISRSLKGLARELDVPVIALSQLSRAVEQRGGEPRLSDLRDSGSIEQDADVVMFIHSEDAFKPKDERTNIKKIIVAKHRNGATGEVELFFDAAKTTFMTVEKNTFDSYGPQASHHKDDDF